MSKFITNGYLLKLSSCLLTSSVFNRVKMSYYSRLKLYKHDYVKETVYTRSFVPCIKFYLCVPYCRKVDSRSRPSGLRSLLYTHMSKTYKFLYRFLLFNRSCQQDFCIRPFLILFLPQIPSFYRSTQDFGILFSLTQFSD